jgi:hypothetical protein
MPITSVKMLHIAVTCVAVIVVSHSRSDVDELCVREADADTVSVSSGSSSSPGTGGSSVQSQQSSSQRDVIFDLPGSGLGLSAGPIVPPPFFSQPTTHFSRSHMPKQPLRGPTLLQRGPLQPKSNFHLGSLRPPPQKMRQRRGFGGTGSLGGLGPGGPPGGGVGRGIGIGIGKVCPDDVVCPGGGETESVVSGGCAISGPSDGPGSSAIGQAEVSVAGAKTSDKGRKLDSPGSQQGPKSRLQPLAITHSLLPVPLVSS